MRRSPDFWCPLSFARLPPPLSASLTARSSVRDAEASPGGSYETGGDSSHRSRASFLYSLPCGAPSCGLDIHEGVVVSHASSKEVEQ